MGRGPRPGLQPGRGALDLSPRLPASTEHPLRRSARRQGGLRSRGGPALGPGHPGRVDLHPRAALASSRRAGGTPGRHRGGRTDGRPARARDGLPHGLGPGGLHLLPRLDDLDRLAHVHGGGRARHAGPSRAAPRGSRRHRCWRTGSTRWPPCTPSCSRSSWCSCSARARRARASLRGAHRRVAWGLAACIPVGALTVGLLFFSEFARDKWFSSSLDATYGWWQRRELAFGYLLDVVAVPRQISIPVLALALLGLAGALTRDAKWLVWLVAWAVVPTLLLFLRFNFPELARIYLPVDVILVVLAAEGLGLLWTVARGRLGGALADGTAALAVVWCGLVTWSTLFVGPGAAPPCPRGPPPSPRGRPSRRLLRRHRRHPAGHRDHRARRGRLRVGSPLPDPGPRHPRSNRRAGCPPRRRAGAAHRRRPSTLHGSWRAHALRGWAL